MVQGLQALQSVKIVALDEAGAGFKVLGVPFGSDEYIRRELEKVEERVSCFCDGVVNLERPQTALLLLRLCGGACRVNHLLRSMHGALIDELAHHIDGLTFTTAEKLAIFFSEASKPQSALPLKMGGLGVQSAVAVQPAASFSGWWRFAIEGLITLTVPPELTEDRGQVPLQALDRLCQALPAQCLLPRQWLVEKSSPPTTRSGGPRRFT